MSEQRDRLWDYYGQLRCKLQSIPDDDRIGKAIAHLEMALAMRPENHTTMALDIYSALKWLEDEVEARALGVGEKRRSRWRR